MAEKIYEVIRLKTTTLGKGLHWIEIEELTNKGTKRLARIKYKHRASTSHNVYLKHN